MSPKNQLDQIQVSSPCSADWDTMIGNQQVRFCEHCNLSVHNLSAMTRHRLLELREVAITSSPSGSIRASGPKANLGAVALASLPR